MEFSEHLAAHLSQFDSAPFLFVGSGLSRRYVSTDDWAGLLRRFADLTDQPYERYVSATNGEMPAVATAIAERFHDIWWEKKEFAASRKINTNPIGRSSPLKIEIANYLMASAGTLPTDGPLAEEIASLRLATVEGIITTNYDVMLEAIFPDFEVFAGQDELLFQNPFGVGELYKIHGSASAPESLVLTAEDYQHYNDRSTYLAAKLLTIFVEHPIIFLGYSLNDPDVHSILTSIAKILTTANLGRLQDRLIFIQWDPTATGSTLAATPFSADGVAIPMLSATVPDFASTFAALGVLKRRFPAKFLRGLKEQIYELVQTSEPKGQVFVSDIEADMDPSSVDVVIGIGVHNQLATQGISGLSRRDLQNDVLEETMQMSDVATMSEIVRSALPRLLRSRANSPIYRYLRGANLLTDDGKLVPGAEVPEAVAARVKAGVSPLKAPTSYIAKAKAIAAQVDSFAELVDQFAPEEVIFAAAHMDPAKIGLDDLRNFIVDNRASMETSHALHAAQWAKCLSLYDLLKWRTA